MKLYDCLVRLSGNVGHEVPKYGITSKEVACLRHLHGDDSVVKIKHSKQPDARRTDSQEAARLADFYGERVVKEVLNVQLSNLEEITIDEEDDEIVVEPVEPVVPVEPEPEILPEPEPEPAPVQKQGKKEAPEKLD